MNQMVEAPDSFMDMSFPMNGIDTSAQFHEQRQGTTVDSKNVRAFESLTQRGRGGSRPGLAKYVTDQLIGTGNLLIQHLNYIVDPAADALIANFAVPYPLYTDTSTNNVFVLGGSIDLNLARNPYQRVIRNGGSGIMLNRHVPGSIQRLVPVITWADPADINVGTPLSGTQLNAVASDPLNGLPVAGVFVYSPASGTVLAEGEDRPLLTTFTPTNQVAYQNNQKTVHIDVVNNELIETHIVADAGNFYGTAPAFDFSYEDQGGFSVQAKDPDEIVVPGTFEYTPDITSTPVMGETSVHVVFTPTDGTTYAGCEGDITVSITRPTVLFNGNVLTAQAGGEDPVGITNVQVQDFGAGTVDIDDISALFDETVVGNVHATSANIGEPIGGRYDFDEEDWFYEFTPA